MIPAGIAVHIFGIGTAFVALLKIIFLISFSSGYKEKLAEEANTEYVALWHVGKELARKYPGKSLLVILAPDKEADGNQQNRIKGLEEGVGENMKISYVPIEYMKSRRKRKVVNYNADKLNELLEDNDHTDVIISLIGLPINYYNMPAWNEDLADFYAYRGYSWEVDEDIREGILTGYITMNPKVKFKGSKENKAEKSVTFFDKYFIFMTKENVESTARKFPALFKLPLGVASE
jgi:hypothetical protein